MARTNFTSFHNQHWGNYCTQASVRKVWCTLSYSFCKKVNNQLNVMIRFRNLICTATKLKLYNALILPHLQYCSTVWHFCSARNRDQLESLNKRALRVVFNDKVSSYQQLLYKSEGSNLYNRRIQNMLY